MRVDTDIDPLRQREDLKKLLRVLEDERKAGSKYTPRGES
jgi:hypothetical protein